MGNNVTGVDVAEERLDYVHRHQHGRVRCRRRRRDAHADRPNGLDHVVGIAVDSRRAACRRTCAKFARQESRWPT